MKEIHLQQTLYVCVSSVWSFCWKCCNILWTNKRFCSWQELYITLNTRHLLWVCCVVTLCDTPYYRDRTKWQSPSSLLKIQSILFPFSACSRTDIPGELIQWISRAAMGNMCILLNGTVLKIQHISDIRSEFTSIKQKPSISSLFCYRVIPEMLNFEIIIEENCTW